MFWEDGKSRSSEARGSVVSPKKGDLNFGRNPDTDRLDYDVAGGGSRGGLLVCNTGFSVLLLHELRRHDAALLSL